MIDDLQQEIAELVLERVEIAASDRVDHFIRFLDRVWRDCRARLVTISRAAGIGIPQPRHAQQILDAIGSGSVVTHGKGGKSVRCEPAQRAHAAALISLTGAMR